MGSTLTVAEAARLIGRTTDAVRKLIERHGVEKIRDGNRYTFRVRTSEVLRAARKNEAR
jgi:excisionase family DNA binding protein